MHYILYAFLTIIIIIIIIVLLLLLLLLIIIIIINYYYYYYYYYHYHYHYRCYFLFATEAISNYWGGLLGPPLLFSLLYVFDVSSFATKKETLVPATQAMIGNDKGPTLERVSACQSTERTWRGRTRGGGDKGSFVLHWFFYNEFEDAGAGTYASSKPCRTNVHPDSCSLTMAHTLLPGDQSSLLSLGRYQSDGMLQNWL